MSLSPMQEENTRKELKANFEKSGLTVSEIASALGTTEAYIGELFALRPKRLEDTWILKNFLLDKVREAGKTPTAFTALGGDYHFIWFLDAEYIDGKKIY